jgi:hypothetical protein
MRRVGLLLLVTSLFLGARLAGAADLSKLDLTGEWYVLITYKDSRSEDKALVHFKDAGWSIKQEPARLVVEEFPYVVFDEGTEEVRKAAMRGHTGWQPEGVILGNLKEHLDVSSRAARKKQLSGDVAAGMKSGADSGAKTGNMNFTRNWEVTWAPAKVRIQIVDSLGGGGAMLGDMEEAAVYEVTAQPAPDELTGTWVEGEKSGTLRMIRSRERRVVK